MDIIRRDIESLAISQNDDDTKMEEQFGLIILGNSGVGKSFLANTLVGRDVFAHKFSSRSVTHVTESEEIKLGDLSFTVFNIPGLIEADQTRIDLNKKEIDKAFALCPISIVMFVFGQHGGRICDEDVVAFNAINTAYPFHPKSLILVVNSLPKDRPSNYEGSTFVLLQKFLGNANVNNNNLCFLDQIDSDDVNERQHLKEKLLQVLVECVPSEHQKKQEIETLIDKLNRSARDIQQLQVQMVEEQAKNREEIEAYQRVFNETMTKHRTEIQSLERVIQRQEELFLEQQRRYEEENQKYQTELRTLRKQAEEAQRHYEQRQRQQQIAAEQLREAERARAQAQRLMEAERARAEAHRQEVERARVEAQLREEERSRAAEQLREAERVRAEAQARLQALANQPPPPPPKKKKHFWKKLW